MRYGKEGNLLSNTFMFLEADVTYWQINITEGKWIPRVMKVFFLDNLQPAELTKCSIPEPRL